MARERTPDEQILVAEGAVEEAYRIYLTVHPLTRMHDAVGLLALRMIVGHMVRAADDLREALTKKHVEAVEQERKQERERGGETS